MDDSTENITKEYTRIRNHYQTLISPAGVVEPEVGDGGRFVKTVKFVHQMMMKPYILKPVSSKIRFS